MYAGVAGQPIFASTMQWGSKDTPLVQLKIENIISICSTKWIDKLSTLFLSKFCLNQK